MITFMPAPAIATLAGPMHVQSPTGALQCSGTWTLAVDAKGGGKITAARNGTGDPRCAVIYTGLPWAIKITGATTARIGGVGFTSAFFGTCGPSPLPLTVSAGTWRMGKPTPPGTCMLNGPLTSSPPENIAP